MEEALEEKGQILPFEPPRLAGQATLGGTLADATAGPGGGYLGATKDFVLGLSMINGRAETLRFGGTVMKNVAGYDISRLMVGSRGELGVILQASIKVLPRVKKTVTLNFDFSYVEAILFLESIATQPHPITASSLHNGVLSLRLSGGEAAVEAARRQLGGEPADNTLWEELREWKHPFFQTTLPLWQLSLPFPPSLPPAEAHLFEWGGRRCWLASSASPDSIHQQAGDWGGYARLFRSDGEMDEDIFIAVAARDDGFAAKDKARLRSRRRFFQSTFLIPAMETRLADFIRNTPAGEEADRNFARLRALRIFATPPAPPTKFWETNWDGPRGRIYQIKQVLEGQPAQVEVQNALGSVPDLSELRDHLPFRRAVPAPVGNRPHRCRPAVGTKPS